MRQPEINIAEKAAFKAGSVLMRMQKQVHLLHVVKKKENDFASIADKASEQAIIETILKAHPDHAILAEEGGLLGNENSNHVWIIDPLDGTTNFLHGFPHYAISIALQIDGEMKHFMPAKDMVLISTTAGFVLTVKLLYRTALSQPVFHLENVKFLIVICCNLNQFSNPLQTSAELVQQH